MEHPGPAGASGHINVSRIHVRKFLHGRPDELPGIDLQRSQQAGNQAGEHRGQQDVAPGIFRFFGERGDAVETNIGERGDGRAGEQRAGGKCCRVIERPGEESRALGRKPVDVTPYEIKQYHDHQGHGAGQHFVDARGGAHAAQVERGKKRGKKHHPDGVGNVRSEISRSLAAPDGADQRVEHVIHGHAPAADVAQRGVQLAAHVSVGGAGAGIEPRHAPVTGRGEQHGHHGDEHGGDHVAVRGFADHAVNGHGRGRLDDHQAVHNQVPKRELAAQPPRTGSIAGRGLPGGHAGSVPCAPRLRSPEWPGPRRSAAGMAVDALPPPD